MNHLKTEEIREATTNLSRFEATIPSVSAIDSFIDGIEIFNNYLDDYPDTQHKEFITNQKIAYTKKLLYNLRLIDSSNFTDWFQTVHALIKTGDICKEIFKVNPKLQQEHDDFMVEWKGTPELSELLEHLSATTTH